MTAYAHAQQRDLSKMMFDNGRLSRGAYEAYLELNRELETSFYADIGVSLADPTGATIIVSGAIDVNARNAYEEWADKYAPHLSVAEVSSLSMSLTKVTSARAEFIIEAARKIPRDVNDSNPALAEFVRARNSYMRMTSRGLRFYGTSEAMIVAAEKLLQDPDNALIFLEAMDVEDKIDYVKRLLESDTRDLHQLRSEHPAIAAFKEELEDSNAFSRLWGLDTEDNLEDSPHLLDMYITDRMGLNDPEALNPSKLLAQQPTEQHASEIVVHPQDRLNM